MMTKTTGKGWGYSGLGALHYRSGMPNQDAFLVGRDAVVVSDGLGSKSHSRLGAQAACRATLYMLDALKNPEDGAMPNALACLHKRWLELLPTDISPWNCSATCLFAAIRSGKLVLGMIGDGMIAAVGTGEGILLSDDKAEAFANFTECLGAIHRANAWRWHIMDTTSIESVVLCTDGISGDLEDGRQLAFASAFSEATRRLPTCERMRLTEKIIEEWKDNGDDKTICVLQVGEGRADGKN